MRGNRLVSFVTALLVVIGAAGCGGGGSGKTASAPANGGASGKSASSGAAAKSASSGGSSGVIRIGYLLPLTGPLTLDGNDGEQGTKLYFDSIHNQIAGKKVQLYFADTQGSSATALTKAKQLVESDHVNLLAGVVSTSACYGLASYVKQAKVPLVITGDCGAEMLQIDSKTASPYLIRTTQTSTFVNDVAGAYLAKHGYSRVVTLMANYAGGTESAGAFDWSYIQNGGRVIQELWPPLNTTDFSSYISQINRSAKAVVVFFPGAGGLRIVEQAANYGLKVPIVDLFGLLTDGSNLGQLKSKAVGIIGVSNYSSAYSGAQNQTLLTAFHKANPGKYISGNVARGYAGAEFIAAALKKLNGNVANGKALLNALYTTQVTTPRGPLKVDSLHDPVGDMFVYRIVKQGSGYGEHLLQTYPGVSTTWDHTLAQIKAFPWSNVKGRFVNITKAQLSKVVGS